MKKILALLLAGCMAFALCACGSAISGTCSLYICRHLALSASSWQPQCSNRRSMAGSPLSKAS